MMKVVMMMCVLMNGDFDGDNVHDDKVLFALIYCFSRPFDRFHFVFIWSFDF